MSGFVGELGQPLAEVILSLDLSTIEREKLATKLTEIAKHLGDYGMDGSLSTRSSHPLPPNPISRSSVDDL